MQRKEFNPKLGDIIICNNGQQYICATKQVIENVLGHSISPMRDSVIYAYHSNKKSWSEWKEGGACITDSTEYTIKEVISMQENQTPAQKAGFVIGRHYECIESGTYFTKSAIYEFVRDDGTYCPMFKYIRGPVAQETTHNGCMYIELHKLKAIKQPHKHAELIKAWADGAVIQCFSTAYNQWLDIDTPSWDNDTQYRIKPEEPKYIDVNGVKVPEPYRVKPGHGITYYVPITAARATKPAETWRWTDHDLDLINFQNGQCFKTAEDAALARDAMLKPFKV